MSLITGIAGGFAGETLAQFETKTLAQFETQALGYISSETNNRIIDTIVVPVTIRERHRDSLTITSHPVEASPSISDHAFVNPSDLEITVGYGAGTPSLADAYAAFRTLQQSLVPFSITTGKRQYENMLIESLEEVTDDRTENILRLELRCKQVIIVNNIFGQALPDNQANAPATADPVNVGTKQLIPSPSLASQINALGIPGLPIQ